MPRRNPLWGCALVAVLLAGCASSAIDLAPEAPDRPWRPATDGAGAIVPGRPASTGANASSGWVLPPNPAVAAVPAPPPLDPEHAYTLPELIDIAQSSHPETRIAWDQARHAALAAGIAASTYLPQVSAAVIGGHRHSSGPGSVDSVDIDRGLSASGGVSALTLQWLMFDFGERDAVVEAARQLSLASNIAFTAVHQQVIHAVSLAFYAYTSAQAHRRTATQALKNAQEVEAAAADRQRRGIGTVIELAQARQATAQARLAEVQTTGALQNAYQSLVAAMGVSPLSKFQVADVSQRTLSRTDVRSVERIVAEALSRRPDVQAAYAAEKASAAGIRAAEADFKPKIFLSATGAYNSGRLGLTSIPSVGGVPPTFNVSGNQWSNTVLFGLVVPLYDAGLRDSRLRQARVDADKAQATSERIREEAVREIVTAQNAVETSLAAHEASKALETAARTTYDAALDAYRHGVGTITVATVAATQWLQASDATTDAYNGALAAAATLAFATGSLGSAPGQDQ
jgi:outer membrane protein